MSGGWERTLPLMPPEQRDPEELLRADLDYSLALSNMANGAAATADGRAVRGLNALSATVALLGTRGAADGPQLAGGSRWTWAAAGTPDGGLILPALDGGVWVREFLWTLTPEMFGARGDGVTDDSAAWAACVAAANTLASAGGSACITALSRTYLVSRGFQLADGVTVRGEGWRTVLKLKPGLPARTNEATQTAMFAGLNAFRNTDAGSVNDVTIRDIRIDLYQVNQLGAVAAAPMLGGVKLVNPNGCELLNVKVTNPQSFGVQLYTTTGAYDNAVTGLDVRMPDWYTDSFGQTINQNSCVGLSLYSAIGANGNGAGGPGVTTTADMLFPQFTGQADYVPSVMRRNTFRDCTVIGGSHGIYATNLAENVFSGNTFERCSHRGFALGNTCDRNTINGNTFRDVGSTGIHMSYSCWGNSISGNTVNGVIAATGEGYGIKGYVGVWNNSITGNTVINARYCAISTAHGTGGNTITGNICVRGTVAQAGTIGIELCATRQAQYDGGLTYADTMTAKGNVITGNTVDGFAYGIMLTDERSVANSVQANIVGPNTVRNCSVHGVSSNGRSSAVVNGNTLFGQGFSGNAADIVSDLRTGNVVFGNGTDRTLTRFMLTSGNTATAAAGANPTKAEFDALLAEVRDLKSKLGNGT